MQRGSKRKELDETRQSYKQERDFTVIEIWECEWWRLNKTTSKVIQHIRKNFAYRCSLTAEQPLEEEKKGTFIG